MKTVGSIFIGLMVLLATGCFHDDNKSKNKGEDITQVIVLSSNTTIGVGFTQQYTANIVLADSTTVEDVPATWSSSNPAIATVDTDGLVTSVAAGIVSITASVKYDGKSNEGSSELVVTSALLTSIAITNANTPNNGELVVGTNLQAVATGAFDDGSTMVVTDLVAWSTSTTTVTVDQAGLITAVSPGAGDVTAAYIRADSVVISATKVGTVVAAVLLTIEIEGDNTTIIGGTSPLIAYGIYDNNSRIDLSDGQVDWASSNILVATIDASGVVTGNTDGSTLITAKSKDSSVEAVPHVMTVTTKQIDHIEIQQNYNENGLNPDITGTTQELMLVDGVSYDPVSPNAFYPTAWAVYTDGTKGYINAQAFWWSDNQQAAYVNTLKGSFVFGRDLIAAGSEATITAVYAGYSASFKVTVVPNTNGTLTDIELRLDDGTQVEGTTLAIDAGSKIWITAYGEYDNSGVFENINSKIFASTSDASVAYILDSLDTNIRGRSEGTAVISFEWQGVTASVTADVNGLSSIEIQEGRGSSETAVVNPGNPLEVVIGEGSDESSGLLPKKGEGINAWGNFVDGSKKRLTTTVFWSTDDSAIATIDLFQRDSVVIGESVGSTNATATLVGVTGNAPVNVSAPAP